jgi:hypothetical protein
MQHILSSPTKSSLEFERATRTVLLDALLKGDDTIAEAVATADEEFKKFKEYTNHIESFVVVVIIYR